MFCVEMCLFSKDAECLFLALVAVIEWMLAVCLLSIETASEGDEWYLGEEFAGEDQGQPGTTGKPPLALASFISYIAMHMLWFTKLHLFRW